MSVNAKKSIDNITFYIPAKTIKSAKEEANVGEIIKLAGNENNLGCSEKVVEALNNAFPDLSRYPEFSNADLAEKLSKKHGVEPDEIVFANGSFELISIIAQTYLSEGEESIIPAPSFGWYNNVTDQAGGKKIIVPLKNDYVDLKGILEAITDKTKLIWICNPNNPTGTGYSHSEVESFIQKVPSNILIILDEAYLDFWDAPDPVRSGELIHKYDNVVALRTFSKLYGLASLRVGYALGNRKITENLHKAKVPIDLSMPGQVAAIAALEDTDFQNKVLNNNREGLQLYYERLNKLGLKYIPSHGNFVMFDTGKDSKWIVEEFLKKGLIIRDGNDFGRPGWLRITIGKPEENEKVLDILEELLG